MTDEKHQTNIIPLIFLLGLKYSCWDKNRKREKKIRIIKTSQTKGKIKCVLPSLKNRIIWNKEEIATQMFSIKILLKVRLKITHFFFSAFFFFSL